MSASPHGERPIVARVALAAIVLVAIALRVYAVATNPPELIVDELDLYNSVHSIAATGHDIDGRLMPFLYCSFTRNPPMYAVAEFFSSVLFGNGPFGLRVPAVAFGTVAVILMYAIAYELTRRRDVALGTALLQATQPIFVHFSRIAWEPASELPFLLGGVYVLLRLFRRDEGAPREAVLSLRALTGGAVLLGLTAYTYMAGWFYAVALGGAIFALNVRRMRERADAVRIVAALALWALVAAPALWMWFGDATTYRRAAGMSTFAGGVNLQSLHQFVVNYVAHFRWSYLVATGDPIPGETWRYLVGFGAFSWWVMLLAVVGLIAAPRYVRPAWAAVWALWWLVVYPLGGSLTNEGIPNAPRTLAGAPVFCLFAAIGFCALAERAAGLHARSLRRAATFGLRAGFGAAFVVSLVLFGRAYYHADYAREFPNAWDSGTRETFTTIRDLHAEYDRLCFSVRPAWYGTSTYFRYYLTDIEMTKIENIGDPACGQPGTLLVTDPGRALPGFAPVKTVRELGGRPFADISVRPRAAQ